MKRTLLLVLLGMGVVDVSRVTASKILESVIRSCVDDITARDEQVSQNLVIGCAVSQHKKALLTANVLGFSPTGFLLR